MDYLGKEIPKLGFGLMRLPRNAYGIDLDCVKYMVDRFLAAGFTYFDTAYVYPGSEEAIKKALVERHPRNSYQLATKLPAWAGAKNTEEARKMFTTSLQRTGAGYFDYYLLHNCGDDRTKAFDEFGLWDYVLHLKEKGFIRHVGFSIHASADNLDEILTKHPEMEFVQLQINYADWDDISIQSRLCYEVAMKHKKPVIIMEPVKGGLLSKLPESIETIFKETSPKRSISSWALRFAASLDNVITVLSGMSDLEQLNDNIKTFSKFTKFSEEENAAIEKAQEILSKIPTIKCTGCRYCIEGCPANININAIFGAMNKYLVFGDIQSAKNSYNFATGRTAKASACTGCRKCEKACPQALNIFSNLKRASKLFDN